MKRITMELGGHAPAIVFNDADVSSAAKILSAAKYRNAGQVCISPTRMLVQDDVFREFVDKFVEGAKTMKVGNGLDALTGEFVDVIKGEHTKRQSEAAAEAAGDDDLRRRTLDTARDGKIRSYFPPQFQLATRVRIDGWRAQFCANGG